MIVSGLLLIFATPDGEINGSFPHNYNIRSNESKIKTHRSIPCLYWNKCLCPLSEPDF